ncbi:MAG: c-type cytochrome [Nitrospirae bacterium]|nr:c-type cytochrome [Nitrospirota bacterium]
MKETKIACCLFILAVFTLLVTVSSSAAEEIEKLTGKKFAQLARGGVLYDNWLGELGVKIDKTHPSYPPAGQKKGAATWRCKECHGWDYKGKAGAYGTGSSFTGIVGIRAYANQNPEAILKTLKNDTHAFGSLMSDSDLEALALFVTYGQIDVDLYINRQTKKSIGDPANGGRIFLSTCIKCHGEDGKAINFKDEKSPEYMGTVANKNPWETLHKIRWGHPGSQMISLLFLGLKEQLDVLSFCQSLPEK